MSEKKIAVITDSSAYIPESALAGLNVSVIPLWLLWEGQNLRDGVDILPSIFYSRLRKAQTLPTSSQPTVPEFIDFYQNVAQNADTIVRDSYNCSMGLGHIVLAAARAAADGKPVEEVVTAAEQMRDKINFIFVVDTLEYLHKGGRIGGAKRMMGTVLRVKPMLEFRDGQIEPLEQVRTKKKAYARLLEIAAERLAGKPMVEATIVDIDNPVDGDAVAQMVVDRFNPKAIHRSEVSPVVGTHTGPGTIGFAFYAED